MSARQQIIRRTAVGMVIVSCMLLHGCHGAGGQQRVPGSKIFATVTTEHAGTASAALQALVNEYYSCKAICDSLHGAANKQPVKEIAFYDSSLTSRYRRLVQYVTTVNGSCTINVKGIRYRVFAANPAQYDIGLHLYNDQHRHFISMGAVKTCLEAKGKPPEMITNAGMYDQRNEPIGLYIENGKKYHGLNMRDVPGGGNFYLSPNGVFYIDRRGHAHIGTKAACAHMEQTEADNVSMATQSGPMLVINSRINDVFTAGSANVNIRSGAGIRTDGKVVFAISVDGCNFYDFACLFRDVLGCGNALYLDGYVSRMYVRDINPDDTGGNFGGMIAVTKK